MHEPYAPHESYIAPARRRSMLPLVILGLAGIELFHRVSYDLLDVLLREDAPEALDAFYLGATPLSLAAQLFSFVFLAMGVLLVARLIHHRGLASLTGPWGKLVPQFRAVFVPLLILLLALEFLPPWWSLSTVAEVRNLASWTAFLPIACLAVFVQIGAEELMYRGYLQQQLAALFPHPAAWLILTNMVFGLAHWNVAAGGAASFQYALWAFFMGLCASDLTARSGTLGPAIAFHLANNLFAFLLYGEVGGYSSGFALFLFPSGSMGGAFEDQGLSSYLSWQLLVELTILLLMWLAARIGLKR